MALINLISSTATGRKGQTVSAVEDLIILKTVKAVAKLAELEAEEVASSFKNEATDGIINELVNAILTEKVNEAQSTGAPIAASILHLCTAVSKRAINTLAEQGAGGCHKRCEAAIVRHVRSALLKIGRKEEASVDAYGTSVAKKTGGVEQADSSSLDMAV